MTMAVGEADKATRGSNPSPLSGKQPARARREADVPRHETKSRWSNVCGGPIGAPSTLPFERRGLSRLGMDLPDNGGNVVGLLSDFGIGSPCGPNVT
jgi:hypothetical protein